MIPFKFSPTVRFTVEGTYNDDKGVKAPFSFWLQCERWNHEKIDEFIKDPKHTLIDFVTAFTTNWGDVSDETGTPVPFTQENLRAFLMQPGMPGLISTRYTQEAGAQAKN